MSPKWLGEVRRLVRSAIGGMSVWGGRGVGVGCSKSTKIGAGGGGPKSGARPSPRDSSPKPHPLNCNPPTLTLLKPFLTATAKHQLQRSTYSTRTSSPTSTRSILSFSPGDLPFCAHRKLGSLSSQANLNSPMATPAAAALFNAALPHRPDGSSSGPSGSGTGSGSGSNHPVPGGSSRRGRGGRRGGRGRDEDVGMADGGEQQQNGMGRRKGRGLAGSGSNPMGQRVSHYPSSISSDQLGACRAKNAEQTRSIRSICAAISVPT